MKSKFPCPMINRSGFTPFQSPATTERKIIKNEKERQKDLAEHGCVDARDLPNRGQLSSTRKRNL